MKKLAVAGVAVLVSSCSSLLPSYDYAKVRSNEYKMTDHPWKSAKDCVRKEPKGKFDARCDIPVVGYRGDGDITPHFGVGSSAGGFSF
jgi:hypothetical protein